MRDRRRMLIAVAASLALHLAVLCVDRWIRPDGRSPAPPDPPAFSVSLLPPDPPQGVVESGEAVRDPVEDAALISDRDSNAQDLQDEVVGSEKAPLGTDTEGFELGGGPPATPPVEQPPPPSPEPVNAPSDPPQGPSETFDPPKEPVQEAPKPAPQPQASAKAERALPAERPAKPAPEPKEAPAAPPPVPPSTEPEPPPEPPVQVAEASSPLKELLPKTPPGTFRGSVEGGIQGEGFVGFEALQHELGAYLLEVRQKVERHWRMAIGLEFTGTMPTKAEVECAIAPDGRLVHVKVIKAGSSPTFAPLCRKSIERAAPFAPFPFKVPDIYSDKNLRIHWTFHFM